MAARQDFDGAIFGIHILKRNPNGRGKIPVFFIGNGPILVDRHMARFPRLFQQKGGPQFLDAQKQDVGLLSHPPLYPLGDLLFEIGLIGKSRRIEAFGGVLGMQIIEQLPDVGHGFRSQKGHHHIAIALKFILKGRITENMLHRFHCDENSHFWRELRPA